MLGKYIALFSTEKLYELSLVNAFNFELHLSDILVQGSLPIA